MQFVIAMLRDEIDILPSFLEHLAALFDGGFILDHRSRDGSSQVIEAFVQQRLGWERINLDFAGQHQAEMSTKFMGRAFERGADCVFFLDADEFILNETRSSLGGVSSRLNVNREVGSLWWRMAIPQQDKGAPFSFEEPMWVSKVGARVCKAVVPRSVFSASGGNLRVGEGNHFVVHNDRRLVHNAVGSILHVPFRTTEQVVLKAIRGCLGQLATGESARHQNVQWYEILAHVRERTLDFVSLIQLLGSYGTGGEIGRALENYELLTPEVSFTPLAIPVTHRRSGLELVAAMLADFEFEDATSDAFRLEGSNVKWINSGVQFRSFREARNLIKAYEARIRMLEHWLSQS